MTLANLHQLPFVHTSFDILFTLHSIYYFNHIQQVMNELYHLLQVHPQLFLSFQNHHLVKQQKPSTSFSSYTQQHINHLFSPYHFTQLSLYHYHTYI
ncbi:methyltransferase domain-containing protein, partial [Bacillus sp. WP8]|uniref:methyltransferase domain-containing protein n=1 Tax=Bacillus sp. WP8 TaxID=756828 RepID=UPI0037BF62AB